MKSLGLIETKGLLPAIECADVMLKSAQVSLLNKTHVGAGLVAITVTGDVAAVQSAVDAAKAALERLGSEALYSSHVIPRPDAGMFDSMFPSPLVGSSEEQKTEDIPVAKETESAQISIKQEPVLTTAKQDSSQQDSAQISTKQEPLSVTAPELIVKQENASTPVKVKKSTLVKQDVDALWADEGTDGISAELTKLTLAKLRILTREYSNLPIEQKKLSKVKKRTLVEVFKRYYSSLNK